MMSRGVTMSGGLKSYPGIGWLAREVFGDGG